MTSSEDIAAGATKGLLSFSEDKIKELVRRFRNKDVHFIKDHEVENVVVEQRKSPEFQIYRQYVKDRHLRLIVSLGLTLRRLRSDSQKRQDLRTKIVNVHGVTKLHAAEFVENEQFARVLPLLLPHVRAQGEMTERIETLLRDIEKYVLFIQSSDSVAKKADEASTRILANNPGVFVLYASGSARKKLDGIVAKVCTRVSNYVVNTTDADNVRSCILTKNMLF